MIEKFDAYSVDSYGSKQFRNSYENTKVRAVFNNKTTICRYDGSTQCLGGDGGPQRVLKHDGRVDANRNRFSAFQSTERLMKPPTNARVVHLKAGQSCPFRIPVDNFKIRTYEKNQLRTKPVPLVYIGRSNTRSSTGNNTLVVDVTEFRFGS